MGKFMQEMRRYGTLPFFIFWVAVSYLVVEILSRFSAPVQQLMASAIGAVVVLILSAVAAFLVRWWNLKKDPDFWQLTLNIATGVVIVGIVASLIVAVLGVAALGAITGV